VISIALHSPEGKLFCDVWFLHGMAGFPWRVELGKPRRKVGDSTVRCHQFKGKLTAVDLLLNQSSESDNLTKFQTETARWASCFPLSTWGNSWLNYSGPYPAYASSIVAIGWYVCVHTLFEYNIYIYIYKKSIYIIKYLQYIYNIPTRYQESIYR